MGPAAAGLVLDGKGALDMEHSIRHIDYFPALTSLAVRNNVQKGVGREPVDFISVAVKDGHSENVEVAERRKPGADSYSTR